MGLKEKIQSNKKKAIIIGSAAAAVLLAAVAVLLIILLGGKNPQGGGNYDEAGIYYFNEGATECELELISGGTFILDFCGRKNSGKYTLSGSALTLDFENDDIASIEASYEGGVITLTYSGVSMRMLKKVSFTVKFHTGGGSAIADAKVLNGKTVAKPDDPTREGFIFVGWYKDSDFKSPFTFTSDAIFGDTEIYARWVEKSADNNEYTISFVLGYDGAVNPENTTTKGARLFGAPSPERAGFDFGGWWISTENNIEKLSYKCTESTVFTENTTLFAVWKEKGSARIEAPSISLSSDLISWGAVAGARSYEVIITDSEGTEVFTKSTSSTSVSADFAALPAGEYEITVTANANSGSANNSVSYYKFKNRVLAKVEGFFVSGESTLVFGEVAGAEKYLITVVCGNPEHNHKDFDNGNSKTYSFANCDMPLGGIKFTVTAVKDNWISSVSDEFVYKRELPAVSDVLWSEERGEISWGAVPGAEYYTVFVTCGDGSHTHEYVKGGEEPTFSLKECAPAGGGISVRVTPVKEGYVTSAPTEFKIKKASLKTPGGIKLQGSLLVFSASSAASGYEVKIDGAVHSASSASLDISAHLGAAGSSHTVCVRALGAANSLWSDPITVFNSKMGGELKYFRNHIYWSPVFGAESYEIEINGESIAVGGDISCAEVALTMAGDNVIRVRFLASGTESEWISTTVFGYSVTFDSLGGSSVDTRYYAKDDIITPPEVKKAGYVFSSWYNAKGGPSANAKRIGAGLFSGSENLVYYAHYTPEKYEITYDYGTGGSGEGKVGEVYFERDYVLEVPKADKVSTVFGGWYESPYGTGRRYTDEGGRSLAPWSELSGRTLYAFWVDETLIFTPITVGGRDAYSVSGGPRISLVSEITVPAYYEGLPVAMVDGNAFLNCTNLTKINLPATVEIISNLDPFEGCTTLTDINVYAVEGVSSPRYTSISGAVLENKDDGTLSIFQFPLGKTGSYTVPEGVDKISARVFEGASIEKVIIHAGVSEIGDDAFRGCKNLTSVEFSAGKSASLTIGKRAFASCSALESLTLPARLTAIELTKYVIGEGGKISVARDDAFFGCEKLALSVESGSDFYKAVEGMLCSADGRELLYCPDSKSGDITVPSSVKTVGKGSFIGCDIASLTVHNSVTYIGECAYLGTPLKSVMLEKGGLSDITIGDGAFKDCASLQSVSTVSDSSISRIRVIGEKAFSGCSQLLRFDFPLTVSTVRARAFENCVALGEVSFGSGGSSLEFGKEVFYNCESLTKVKIPNTVTALPGIFGGCSSLTEVEVEKGSAHFTSVNGVVFNVDKTEILFYPQSKAGDYTIPDTVTTIAAGVFASNKAIGKLTVPLSVSYIGEGAFRNSKIGTIVFSGGAAKDSLVIAREAFKGAYFEGYDFTLPSHTSELGEYAFSEIFATGNIILNEGIRTLGAYCFYTPSNVFNPVAIPASVEVIGEYCFAKGELLGTTFSTYVTPSFPNSNSRLTEIGSYAFYQNKGVGALALPASVRTIGEYAFYECSGITALSLSDSLESIGAYAFAAKYYADRLHFTTLTIPAGVSYIGARAFENCGDLKTVTFLGTASSFDLYLGSTYLREYTENGVDMVSVEQGRVFASCGALTEVTLSANVTVLGDYSFAESGAVGFKVTLSEDSRLSTIGACCFYNSRLSSFAVPASVRNLEPTNENGVGTNRYGIGDYAFASSYLTEITFLKDKNNYPLTIGYGAFMGQKKLEAIELPARLAPYSGTEGIIPPLADGPLVFDGLSALTAISAEAGGYYKVSGGALHTSDMKVLVFCPRGLSGELTVAASVTKIHDYAFYACESLTAIRFDGGSTPLSIGKMAFFGCKGISEMVLPTRAISLGESALGLCTSLKNLTLSKNLKSFEVSLVERCIALCSLTVESGNSSLISIGGVLFDRDKKTLILYPAAKEGSVYEIPSGVLYLGKSAFRGASLLEEVILPDGLIEIRGGAFSECSALSTIAIPSSVELVADFAFGGLSSLSSLSFDMGGSEKLVIGEGAFEGIGAKTVILPARLAIIGKDAFRLSEISSLSFESADNYTLTEIGDGAFFGSSLISVKFPGGITTVGAGALGSIATLDKVTFEEGLLSLGEEAFAGSSLTKITLPASLVSFGKKAFANCSALTSVIFPANSMLEAIAEGTFLGCVSLSEIEIPAYVKEIRGVKDSGAFENCVLLEYVTFKSNVNCAKIGAYSFLGCKSIAEFIIPDSVSELGNYAFSGCTSLTEITIPLTAAKLGDSLFEGCTALDSVDLKSGAAVLGERAFFGCASLTEMFIPRGVTVIGKDCFKGTSIESFEVEEGSHSFISLSGIVYNYSQTEIVAFPPKFASETLFIPKGITSIPASNFEGFTNIREVVFEEGGTAPLSIGESAFRSCYKLRRLVLPERLVSIGKYAFKECHALTSVTIPKNCTSIADFAFSMCYKLYEVRNESQIQDIGKKGSIKVAQPNVNIYTPTEGASVLSTEGEFLFATIGGSKLLIGYLGRDSKVVLPEGTYSVANYLFQKDDSVKQVIIPNPEGISIGVSQAFTECANFEAVGIGAATAPESWDTRWHSGKPVMYTYTGEEITYNFVVNGGEEISPISSDEFIALPTPKRSGYAFLGWYTDASLSGEPVSGGSYYSSTATTLYAGWMDEHLRLGGKSADDAFEVDGNLTQTIYVDKAKEKIYFKLSLTESAEYTVTATPIDRADVVIYVYNASLTQLVKLDSKNVNVAETLTRKFEANGTETVYYIVIQYTNSDHIGKSEVSITKTEPSEG